MSRSHVAVPAITPAGDSVRPAGSDPAVTSHVTSDGRPEPSSVAEYGEPTAADLSDSVLIPQRRAHTSNVNSVSALLLSQSFSAIQALKVPTSVATPSTTLLSSAMLRIFSPGGSAPDRISR